MKSIAVTVSQPVPFIAKAGLIAKGFVYVLMGTIVLLSSLNLRDEDDVDKAGILAMMNDSFVGKWLLPFVAFGLICYAAWRFTQVYRLSENMKEKWKKVLRYFFSGAVYLSIGYSAFQLFLNNRRNNDDGEQLVVAELLSKPMGQWLVGAAALIIACVGIYQMYYGLSGKYKRHVSKLNTHSSKATILTVSGAVGYTARGVVWMIIAYLMFKAAFANSSRGAGDTGKAFNFIESTWGAPVLALIAAGLIAYGFFNFVRVRYEQLSF